MPGSPVRAQVYVRKRPYLDKFLRWIHGKFEITIFTASQQARARVCASARAGELWRALPVAVHAR